MIQKSALRSHCIPIAEPGSDASWTILTAFDEVLRIAHFGAIVTHLQRRGTNHDATDMLVTIAAEDQGLATIQHKLALHRTGEHAILHVPRAFANAARTPNSSDHQ